jgi:hypothetical protein
VKEESGILFYRWGATSYAFDAAAESTHIFQVQRVVVVMLSKMIFIAVFTRNKIANSFLITCKVDV